MSISSNIKSWANTAMILTMGVGVYFYIEDSRRALQEVRVKQVDNAVAEAKSDEDWKKRDDDQHDEFVGRFDQANKELEAIRIELASQTQQLNSMKAAIHKLEGRHDAFVQILGETKADLLLEVGRHQGYHMRRCPQAPASPRAVLP